ncbi:MAG: TlpA disulfide reductase family protein [Vulcanimicrobiaceae bacterium]
MFRFVRVLVCAVACASFTTAPALAVPHAGDAAPGFTLPKAEGGTLSFAQLRGKPTYLNFFASWCAPCNAEAASVGELYKKFHKRGLAVVGVNEQEDKAKALGFAAKYRWPFAVVLDDGAMGKDYGAFALPVHIFIDKRGKVSTYRLGEMAPNELEEAIRKIL